MIYRKHAKSGDEISSLGFGCMRLPRKAGGLDFERSKELIHYAIDNGVNYFDTAYLYYGNEELLGKIITGGLRQKVFIATKLPVIRVSSKKDFDKFLEIQLKNLKTDYIDYYLLHMLVSFDQFKRLSGYGIEEWAGKQKELGKIRNFGFSFHGTTESFKNIIDAHNWDLCLMQHNYIDEYFQAGSAGLEHANKKGVPVAVMEPLRGGMLADKLPTEAKELFYKADDSLSPAEWGIKYVLSKSEVNVVLSGMNEIEQLKQNIALASSIKPVGISEEDKAVYKKACDIIRGNIKVNCTGCGYCMPCPHGVDIPGSFSYYNNSSLVGRMRAAAHYIYTVGVAPKSTMYASKCKRCGKCETHCPQNIAIMDELQNVKKALEPAGSHILASAIRAFTQKDKK